MLKTISTDPFHDDDLSDEDQLNKIYKENNITKDNIISIVPHGSSVYVTFDDGI